MLTNAALAALAAGSEPFSFYPPVRGFAENRWRFHEATRAEFGAVNLATNDLVWFARGSVSYITAEEGGVTVTLNRELEYSGSAVWPVRQPPPDAERLAPATPAEALRPPARPRPAEAPQPVPAAAGRRGLRGDPLVAVLGVAGGAAVALVLALVVARAVIDPPQRADATPIADSRLFTLVREDNYHDVVRKIGPPESERALSLAGSDVLQQALIYPSRNYAVVMLGVRGQRNYEQEPHYIGAIRLSDGAVVSSVHLAHDSTTDSLLRSSARQLLTR